MPYPDLHHRDDPQNTPEGCSLCSNMRWQSGDTSEGSEVKHEKTKTKNPLKQNIDLS